jgi:hypothetical protein
MFEWLGESICPYFWEYPAELDEASWPGHWPGRFKITRTHGLGCFDKLSPNGRLNTPACKAKGPDIPPALLLV